MKGFDGKDSKSNVKQLRPGQSGSPENAKAELLLLRDQIAAMVEKDPRKAASILADWIAEIPKSKPAKKAG